MLSAYAEEFVDTEGAIALNSDEMLENHNIIDFENNDGSNTVYLFSEPITYVDEDGDIKAKDISVEKQTDKELKSQGYAFTNGQNDYRINFSEASDKGLLIEYEKSSYRIIPQSDFAVIGTENTSYILGELFENFEYKDIYGSGTNLKFYPQLNGVKDEIILNHNPGINEFSFKIITENCFAVLNDNGTVSLISNEDKKEIQTFSAPFAFDSDYIDGYDDEHRKDCAYKLENADDNSYILTVVVPEEWLSSNTTAYPVTIDPTTSSLSNSADAGVSSVHFLTNYGNSSTGGFGKSAMYGYGRVYEKFELPSAIKPGAKISYAYHWVRETTQATDSTYVRPFMVKGDWKETGINWNNMPKYDDTVNTNWKNINGNSADKANSPHWYNYNLVNCVKKWVNGTSNNGVVFVSGEEVDADQEYKWRAFASRTHETSAMRPYTVINYTNDTTAPTVKVNVDKTEFTKDSVKIYLTDGSDTGGAGIHKEPFSFSTEKGKYYWGTAESKSYSENCTVYVSIRDKADNIKTYTVNISNIDNEGPEISNVSLSSDGWTNQNIDLTVFSADAVSGVKDYSFSTESGIYAWQTSNKKSFSENTTVYVASRDNLDNVSEETVVKIDKIDKDIPSAPAVTGDNNGWVSANTVLTANSTDKGSGISQYSFSSALNEFNWQNENTFSITKDATKLFVYSKDKAGNISEPQVVEYRFDESLPSGFVSAENPSDWVRYVNITADGNDEVSGLHEAPYSFSRSEGTYSWQKDNVYKADASGTYYVYVRDSAGNITLLDTVTIDKIDSTAPTIDNIDIKDDNDRTIITVTAKDSQSGVAEYSIDNGKTWQQSNVFEIEKDALNYIAVKVKDTVGNISYAKYKAFHLPDYYIQNGCICLYNPRPETGDTIYYRFPGARAWSKYVDPIKLDGADTIYLSYYNNIIALIPPKANEVKLDYEPQSDADKFGYTESATDLMLKYKALTFDISRSFDNGEWHYSYNSSAEFVNSSLIKAVLPDFSEAYFVKENKYSYTEQLSNAKLMMIYDEADEHIIGCSIKTDSRSYGYKYNGEKFILSSVSDFYGNSFDFTRQNNRIAIVDNSGRECIIECDNNTTTLADFNGGIITYNYADDNLVSVTDQTGVVIDSYTYSDGKITKSGMMSVEYDSSGRVVKYHYDNGAYTAFEYGENSVTTTNSKEEVSSYTYDSKDRIISETDNLGDETVYTYDDNERTVKISRDGEVLKTYKYNADGTLFSEQPKDKDATVYYYDSYKRVITEITPDDYIHYVYDDFGNLTMTARVKDYYIENKYYYFIKIQNNLDYYNITRYTYENGLLVKSYDEENDVTVLYEYDDYGNTVLQTTLTVKDDATQIVKTESRYDILGRLVWSKSNDSETEYTYDAAGRLLLTKTDDNYYQRTVYDNNGRIVQEIDNDKYDPLLDNLPYAYSDTTAGKTYVYNQYGDLIKETNSFGISTDYEYSDTGNVYRKHFDIYDYYYTAGGKCDKVTVNGNTIVDYTYSIDDSSVIYPDAKYVTLKTYADGYEEKQTADKYGTTYFKSANNNSFYNVSLLSKGKSLAYKNLESQRHNTITVSDNYYSFDSRTIMLQKIFDYSVKTADNVTTVNETHYNTPFETVITEDSIKYKTQVNEFVERENIDVGLEPDEEDTDTNQQEIHTTEYATKLTDREFSYSVQKNEDKVTETITGDLNRSLTAEQYFDEESNTYHKAYVNGLSFHNTYDDDGNIIGDENNSYTYNELGELISTSGLVNASYQYDSRGNITSKTVDGNTATYAYDNEWKDQLTAVNGIPLTYDANGNLASYGDSTYTWSHGKQLESVTNEKGTYNYTYDENGIRLTKPGYTFNTFNGRVLAQHGANNIYFQYNGDKPIGFILNQNQYYYLTNPSGDIVGITDSKCDLIATYTYDEWGKLLEITADNDDNRQIAETNPLRYRGYYYDNETGYYYLQSRYYDPDLGRFISADDFSYVDTSHELNMNAYSYCWNSPIALEDAEGTTPQISIDLSALQPLVEDATTVIKAGLNKLAENIKKLISRYNDFLDKLEFSINHPDVVINNGLSKILGREVSIKFPLINAIRAYFGTFDIRTGELVGGAGDGYHTCSEDADSSYGTAAGTVVRVIISIFELSFISDIIDAFGKVILDGYSNFNSWYNSLSKDAENRINEFSLSFAALINSIIFYFTENFKNTLTVSGTLDTLKGFLKSNAKADGTKFNRKEFGIFSILFNIFAFVCNINEFEDKGPFDKKEFIIIESVNLVVDLLTLLLPPGWDMVVDAIADIGIKTISLRLLGLIFPF